MSSNLLSIAASGVNASQIALDVTSQNIANASTDGYVRRSVQQDAVSSAGSQVQISDISLSGVRVSGITRDVDAFRQADVRRTGADAARADSEVAGLSSIEAAVEQSNVYPTLVNFEGALQQLASNPTDSALRTQVIQQAQTVASTFNLASQGLNSAGLNLQAESSDGVNQVNVLAGQLSQINLSLARSSNGTSDQSALLDQRDLLLKKLSAFTDIDTSIAPDQTVSVRLGGSGGLQLVNGGTAATLAMNTAADGTISFTLGGTPVTPSAGSLAGNAQALTKLADINTKLDTVATGLMNAINSAQASGVALDGSTGQPMFSGTGARDIAVSLTDGSQIASAPYGAGANSTDPSNLNAMNSAFSSSDPPGAANALILDISSTVSSRTGTQNALDTIANNAQNALDSQSGVSLDQEAVNLIRYQQSLQASSRAIQVASDTFNTLLALH